MEKLQAYCGLPVDSRPGPLVKQAIRLLLPHTGGGEKITEHFREAEFTCRCVCGIIRVNIGLVNLLEKLREAVNKPVLITSGYRCPAHNQAVGGAENSQHLLGNAADITVSGVSVEKLAAIAESMQFMGIGKYSGFLHVEKIKSLESIKNELESQYQSFQFKSQADIVTVESVIKYLSANMRLLKSKNLDACKRIIQDFVDKVIVTKDCVEVVFKITVDLNGYFYSSLSVDCFGSLALRTILSNSSGLMP